MIMTEQKNMLHISKLPHLEEQSLKLTTYLGYTCVFICVGHTT